MISGFLGSLITLERAAALKQKWMYIPPLCAGLGWVFLLMFQRQPAGPVLLTLASLGGVFILIEITRREFALHTLTMLVGSLAWFLGNALWLTGFPIHRVVFLWQAFLILTIAGERLELSRVLRPSALGRWLFGGILAVYLAGLVVFMFDMHFGARLSGSALLALAVWSVWNDIAWRNLGHKHALTRYIARCLALGFVWLGFGGILNLIFGAQAAGPRYDAVLHVVFVGFVISMIFGHAPIIFPAVLGLPISFSPAFYIHLALLHVSLFVRVLGDFMDWHPIRMWGGLFNEAAILLFLGTTIYSAAGSLKRKR